MPTATNTLNACPARATSPPIGIVAYETGNADSPLQCGASAPDAGSRCTGSASHLSRLLLPQFAWRIVRGPYLAGVNYFFRRLIQLSPVTCQSDPRRFALRVYPRAYLWMTELLRIKGQITLCSPPELWVSRSFRTLHLTGSIRLEP